jgi:RHS repeat-associated protein
MKNNFPFSFLIAILFFYNENAYSQLIGRSSNGSAPGKEVAPQSINSGSLSGDVNLFTGTYNTSYSLGTVSTLSGLSFTANLSYNSSFSSGDNMPNLSGVPYGEGWSLELPMINVSVEDYNKYSEYELKNIGTTTQKTPLFIDYDNNNNCDAAKQEGRLYWYAPTLSIPGVASGRLVYKQKEGDDFVFVLNRFEKYIEARLTMTGTSAYKWRVITDDGTEYLFKYQTLSHRNPTNQRVQQGCQDAATLKQLILPKTEINTWYCEKISHPNHVDNIIFEYSTYGAFDNFRVFKKNWGNQVQNFVADIDALNMLPITGSEVFIKKIKTASDELLFTYGHEAATGLTIPTFPLNASFTAVDDLFAKTTVKNYTTFNGTNITTDPPWKRYNHIRSDEASLSCNRSTSLPFLSGLNPYIATTFPSNSASRIGFYSTKPVSETGWAPFNHGYLESPRIPSSEIVPGDTYEVNFVVDNSNGLNDCLFDVNLATGDNSVVFPTGSTVGIIGFHEENDMISSECLERKTGESVFTTFNQAIKWGVQVGGQSNGEGAYINYFQMPNLPPVFNGFHLQIGPANSDINYANDQPLNSTTPNVCTAYTQGNLNASQEKMDDKDNSNALLKSEASIPHNFGIGASWFMTSSFYNPFTACASNENSSWWNDKRNIDGNVFPNCSALKQWRNQPTRASRNTQPVNNVSTIVGTNLVSASLTRFAKRPYMVKSVTYSKKNNLGALTAIQKVELSYEIKQVDLYTPAYIDDGPNNVNDKNITYGGGGKKRNVVLLNKIRQIDPLVSTQTLSTDKLPTTKFTYKNINPMPTTILANSWVEGTFPLNGNFYVLETIENPLGGLTTLEYYDVSPQLFNTLDALVVSPTKQSYMAINYWYNLRPNEYKATGDGSSCEGCSYPMGHPCYSAATNINPYSLRRGRSYAFQIYYVVKNKKVTERGTLTTADITKTWNYNFENLDYVSVDRPDFAANYVFDYVNNSIKAGFRKTTVKGPDATPGNGTIATYRHYTTNPTYGSKLWGKLFYMTNATATGQVITTQNLNYAVSTVFEKPWNTGTINHPDFPNIPSATVGKVTTFDMPYFYETRYPGATAAITPDYLKSFFIKLVKDSTTVVEYPGATAGGTSLTINEYEYFDAEKASGSNALVTNSNGYKEILGGTLPITLTFEPSWQLYRTKSYSNEYGPSNGTNHLFNQEEHFYLYDLANKASYQTLGTPITVNTGFKNLAFAHSKKMRNVEFETRTTSKPSFVDAAKIASANVVYATNLIVGKLLPMATWTQVDASATHPVTTFTGVNFTESITWNFLPTTTFLSYDANNLAPTETQDVLGLKTKRTYNANTGLMTQEIVGNTLIDALTTDYLYFGDNTLQKVTYPNSLVYEYTYDALKRPISTKRNGTLLQETAYSQNNGMTGTFFDKTKRNFVEQKQYTSTTDNIIAKSFLDPLGRNVGTIKDGTLIGNNIYDYLDRPVYQITPVGTAAVPQTAPQTIPSATLTNDIQMEYEVAPRNRVTKAAKYGQNLTPTGKFVRNMYSFITADSLKTLLTQAGQTDFTAATNAVGSRIIGTKFMNVTTIDEDGKINRVISNLFGQQVATIGGSGLVATVFWYNNIGTTNKVVNPKGQISTYSYNFAGLLFEKTTPDEGTTKYAYNKAGQVIADKNAANETRLFQYDMYGRMILQKFLPSTETTTDLFANNGLPWLSSSFTTSATNYTMLLTNASGIKEKEMFYNGATGFTTLFDPKVTTWLTNNAATNNTKGRLAQAISYNLIGQPINMQFLAYNNDGFFKTEILQFNDAGITTTAKGIVNKLDYPDYNYLGNIKTQNVDLKFDAVHDLQYTYTYDKRNRMTNVYVSYTQNGTAGRRIASYTYNDVTDLIFQKKLYDRLPGGTCERNVDIVEYIYDQRFRLTSMVSNTFDYKLAYDGNQVMDGTTNLTTGNLNVSNNYNGNINSIYAKYKPLLFTSVSKFKDGTVYSYQYDALNRLTTADAKIGVNDLLSDPATSFTANEKLFGDNTFTFDKVGNIDNTNIGLFDAAFTTVTEKKYKYNYTTGTNKLTTINDITGASVVDRTVNHDNLGRQTTDSKRGIFASTYRPSNLIWSHAMSLLSINYQYDHVDSRIFKNTLIENGGGETKEYYLHNVFGQEIAIINPVANTVKSWYVQGREREARFTDQRFGSTVVSGFSTGGGEDSYRASANTKDIAKVRYPVNLLLVGDTAGNPLGYLLEPEMEEEAQRLLVLQRITIANPNFRLYCTDTLGYEARVVTLSDVLAIRATGERFYLEGYNSDCKPHTPIISAPAAIIQIDPLFYIYDHLGNTRVVYSTSIPTGCGTGATAYFLDYAADYSPYGRVLRSFSAVAQERYLSTQHERDVETGYDNRGARLYDSETGRFISIDPMAGKYVEWSPYNYVVGNPIVFVDQNGKDFILYIIVLKGADQDIANRSIKKAEQFIKEAGLNTKVEPVYNQESFDITKIDRTDGVAVIGGNKKESSDFIMNNFDKGYLGEHFKDVLKGNFVNESSMMNPELSDSGNGTWGYVIATSTKHGKEYEPEIGYSDISKQFGVKDPADVVGLTILHGMGHNAGIQHGKNDSPDNGFMMGGSFLAASLRNTYKGDISALIKYTIENHPNTMKLIYERYQNKKDEKP